MRNRFCSVATMVTVLMVISVSAALPAPPVQTQPAGGGAIELLPKAAKLKGRLKLDSAGAVKGWNNKSMSLEWAFTCNAAGSYRVEVLQSTSPSAKGNSKYKVVVADQTLEAAAKPTKGWDDYEPSDVGIVQLAAGPATLAIRPTELHGGLMNLKSVTLTPTSDRPAAGNPTGAGPKPAQDTADASKTVIELDGEADEACAGGAGRYLIFHPKGAQQLVVVDVVAGKLLNPLPTPGEFRFAADRDKLLLVLNGQHILQRWDLKTQTREQTALIEGDEPVKIAAMGDAGSGPLALWSGKKVELYNVATLKPLKVTGTELEFSGDVHLVPSADGLTFAAFGWTTGQIQLLRLSNVSATSAICTQSDSKAWVTYNAAWGIPGPDGSLLVAHDAEPNVYVMGTAEQDTRQFKGAALYPTEDPRFLALLRPVEKKKSGSIVSLVAANDLRILYTIPDVEPVTGGMISTFKGRLGFLPRVNYLPAEKRLIVIPDSNDRVVVRPFDLAEALKSTGADYLFVISRPATRIKPGEQFSYQVEALCNSGKLKYKLEQGPTGMAISPAGLVTWHAAAGQKDGKVGVILAVSDSSGQEVNQAFEIELVFPVTVVANTSPPATVPQPEPPHRPLQGGMPKPPARNVAAKPVNPADPDLSAYAALLASRVQAAQQRGAMMDPETIGSVNVSALSAARTPDGARIVLASHQDIPKDQDFRSIRSTIEVMLTPLPGGKWACAEARARVDSVTSSHGPLTDEPSRWQIITRDMQKIVDSISGQGGAEKSRTQGSVAAPNPTPAAPLPNSAGANAGPSRQPHVGLKVVGLWEADLVIDEAKAQRNPKSAKELKSDRGGTHFAMELCGDSRLYIDDFATSRGNLTIAMWKYVGEKGNAVTIRRFQGTQPPREMVLTVEADGRMVADVPDLDHSIFKTDVVFNRVGNDNVVVGMMDPNMSLRDLAIDWIAQCNSLGPKDKLVDDMTRMIDQDFITHRDVSLLFGAGLMKSGQATWIFCHAGRFFYFELSDEQAAKAHVRPGDVVHGKGEPDRTPRLEDEPEVEIGLPIFDVKGPIVLGQPITGREPLRTLKDIYNTGEPYSFRLCYQTPKQAVTLYNPLAAPPLISGETYSLKFPSVSDKSDYAGPIVLFLDFCQMNGDPQGENGQTVLSGTTFGVLVDVKQASK